MARKVGRPPVVDPKNYRVTIRLNKQQKEILIWYTEKYHVTRNEAIRRGVENLVNL